jgi:hypothetical protein
MKSTELLWREGSARQDQKRRSPLGIWALITDRKIAERKLREWLEGLVHPRATPRAEMTFGELLDKHRAVNAGKSVKTIANIHLKPNSYNETSSQLKNLFNLVFNSGRAVSLRGCDEQAQARDT